MLIPLKEVIQKYNLDIKGVVHLGANTGQERDVYKDLGLKVIWVEAIPDVYLKLVDNLSGYDNQIALLACVSDEDGIDKIFNISNNEAQSSSYLSLGTHKVAHPEVTYIDKISVKTIRVDSLMKTLSIEIDNTWLLMADLQGSEMDALKGCGDLLNKFGFCYLEINEQPLYEGCALKGEIESYLSNYNFVPVEEFVYKQWGWGDEFFIKRN